MVSQFYGLTHQEVALRRDVLGLPKHKGRHPVLTEEQDTLLWKRWHPQLKARNIDLANEGPMLELTLDTAEELSLPASVIWGTIKQWVAQGLV